jgi:squalene-associated FAD-dependent desaturase
MTAPDVIVVGAGVAGLSTATALADGGARVLVVEARPRPGGRAMSATDPVTGEPIDNGQHILMGCYRESMAFLSRLGTAHLVRVQPHLEVSIVDRDGRLSTLSCPPLPSPWHLLGGIIEWDALTWRDRLSVLRLGPVLRLAQQQLAGRTSLLAASPGETVENWLIRNGQTPRLRELLWEPLALAAMNQPPGEAGAAAFVRVLAQAFGPDPRDSAIALPAVPLNDLYVEPARRHLQARGSEVRTGAVARVRVDGGLAAGVTLRDGQFLRAGAVVAAVPWHAFGGLFDVVPPPLADIAGRASRMKGYPIVTVNIWFDRPVLDRLFVGLPGREMQWAFDKRAVFEGAASHLSLVSSGAAHLVARTNREVIDLALAELRQALPAAAAATVRHASVIRERNSTFSVAPGEPARPGCRTDLPGLFLAGDWTDTGLPGTIESAAASGHTAARDLLEARG